MTSLPFKDWEAAVWRNMLMGCRLVMSCIIDTNPFLAKGL